MWICVLILPSFLPPSSSRLQSFILCWFTHFCFVEFLLFFIPYICWYCTHSYYSREVCQNSTNCMYCVPVVFSVALGPSTMHLICANQCECRANLSIHDKNDLTHSTAYSRLVHLQAFVSNTGYALPVFLKLISISWPPPLCASHVRDPSVTTWWVAASEADQTSICHGVLFQCMFVQERGWEQWSFRLLQHSGSCSIQAVEAFRLLQHSGCCNIRGYAHIKFIQKPSRRRDSCLASQQAHKQHWFK